jgi:arginase family enzyme
MTRRTAPHTWRGEEGCPPRCPVQPWSAATRPCHGSWLLQAGWCFAGSAVAGAFGRERGRRRGATAIRPRRLEAGRRRIQRARDSGLHPPTCRSLGRTRSGGRVPGGARGDCSILLGAMLALRRIGRYGLAFIDGHSDFRHPGNSSGGNSTGVGAAAGEDLRLLRTLVASPRRVGLQLTIYDPDLDPEARCARILADLIEHALAA